VPEIQYIMEHTFPLSVPMRVDPEIGENWSAVKGLMKIENKNTGDVKVETLKHFIERTVTEAKAA
jgi:hypothetical protein